MPTATAPSLKIAIIGAPTSSGNRGVLALASGLVNLFSAQSKDIEFTMLVGAPQPIPLRTVIDGKRVEIKAINYRHTYKSGLATCLPWIFLMSLAYRLLPLKGWRAYLGRKIPWIGCLAQADLVGDVRGGDSFSDIYGMKRYLWGFICAWTAILVHGDLVQFPQTYGPYKSKTAQRVAKFLLNRASAIVARDTKSRAVARGLAPHKDIRLSPDVAFALTPIIPETWRPLPKPAIGINVNGLMYNGGYDRKNMFGLSLDYPQFLEELVKGLLDEGEANVWLVPHTYAPEGDVESDNECCQILKDRLPEKYQDRVHVIEGDFNQHEIKGIIGQCDAFLGSRMHSCIAALSQGIPCVGLAYSMKFLGVFESVGMGDWVVDAREVNTEEAVRQSITLIKERESRRAALNAASQQAREKLNTIFAQLLATTPHRSH